MTIVQTGGARTSLAGQPRDAEGVFGRVNTATVENETAVSFLLRLISTRKLIILTSIFGLVLSMFLFLAQATPRYTASTTVIVTGKQVNLGNIAALFNEETAPPGMDSEIEIIRSRKLVEKTIDDLGLLLNPDFNTSLKPVKKGPFGFIGRAGQALGAPGPTSAAPDPDSLVAAQTREEVIETFYRSLSVKPVGQSSVLAISFEWHDRELAKRIVKHLAEIYIDNQLDVKFDAMQRVQSWLSRRLDVLREQVQASEEAIEAFRLETGLIGGVRSALVTEQVSDLSRTFITAREELAGARARLQQTRAVASNPGLLEGLPEAMEYQVIRDMRQQETALLNREAELSAQVGDRHPELVRTRAQLTQVRQRILEEVGRVARRVEQNVQTQEARVASLQRELNSAQARASQSDASSIRLRALEREAEANQALLQSFLQRSKELSERYDIEEADARVLSPAFASAKPTWPNGGTLMAISAIVGLALGLVAAYLAELLDQTYRTSDEVEVDLGLPSVLIPRAANMRLRSSLSNFFGVSPRSVVLESLRALRTYFRLSDAYGPARCVAVTAPRRRDQSAQTALSLALTAALDNERVIIVNCDTRDATIDRAFSNLPKQGLTDLLAGSADRDSVINEHPRYPNLHFMRAGEGGLGGREQLLSSPKMSALVRELRKEFDLVILNAPPVYEIAEGRVLTAQADGVVFCLRQRVTTRSHATRSLKLITAAGGYVLCAALTNVNSRSIQHSGGAVAPAFA